jgi:hypothetical protein
MILMKTQRTVMLLPRMRRQLVTRTKARTTATRGQRNQRTRRRKGSDSVGFFYFSLHVIITAVMAMAPVWVKVKVFKISITNSPMSVYVKLSNELSDANKHNSELEEK